MAIKKIIDIQEMDEIDSMRTLREIKINRHLDHENVAKLTEVFPSTVLHPFNEVRLASPEISWLTFSIELLLAILSSNHPKALPTCIRSIGLSCP